MKDKKIKTAGAKSKKSTKKSTEKRTKKTDNELDDPGIILFF